MTSRRQPHTRDHKSSATASRSAAARRGVPSLQSTVPATVIALLAVAAVVFLLTYRPVSDSDTWFHLELGQWIGQNHKLPHTDPFSYTAGATPYVPSGWLSAWLMAKLDLIYPESSLGPILMVTLAIGLAAGIIMARAWRCATIGATALLLMLGLNMAVVRFSPRPDVWSIAGLTALLALLSRGCSVGGDASKHSTQSDPPGRALWLLVPLMVLWANLHAGVLVALPFLGSYAAWLAWQWHKHRQAVWLKAMLPVAVASVAWLANPYGFGLVGLAMHISQIPEVGWVMEWMPFFTSKFPLAWPVYVGAGVLLGAAVWALRKSKLHPLEILWLAMLLALALWQRRQISLLAVGAPLLLARHLVPLQAWLSGARWRGVALPATLAAAIAVIQISGANGNGGGMPGYGRVCNVLPCITGDFLAANPPPEPIFNSYNMGGYLLHVLYPETKVYIDGRLDVYPSQVWLDMLALEENRFPIDDMIARYGIKTFVVSCSDSFGDSMHLSARLAARSDMALVHLDDYAAVFVHRTADAGQWASNFAYQQITPWKLPAMDVALANPARRQALLNEVARLVEQSGHSTTASALGAYVAWRAGDKQTAQEWLATAAGQNPTNGMVRQVQRAMGLIPAAR